MAPLIYEPLQTGHVRLVAIEQGNGDIECDMVHLDVRADQVWTALSSVWGTEKSETPIYVNGMELYTTANLTAALKAIRHKRWTVMGEYTSEELRNMKPYYWIDAICINQNDLEEKQEQIPLMNELYSKAGAVQIWLGQASEEGRMAFEVMNWLNANYAYENTDRDMESLGRSPHDIEIVSTAPRPHPHSIEGKLQYCKSLRAIPAKRLKALHGINLEEVEAFRSLMEGCIFISRRRSDATP